MSQKTILTPSAAKKALKEDFIKRTNALKEVLPRNWKLLFIHDNKDYKDHTSLLSDVMACRSLHLETLVKIEKWSKKLTDN